MLVVATAPWLDVPKARGGDSGFTVLVCRHLDGGELLEVSRGHDLENGTGPMLIGRLHRPGLEDILVEAPSRTRPLFGTAFAQRLLRDRLLGLRTSERLNRAGERLRHFHTTRSTVTLTLDPPA